MDKQRNSKAILAKNLAVLMSKHGWKQDVVAKKTRGKMDQTTVGRIKAAKVSTSTEKIDALAAVFEIEPWMLLVPDLDPANLPVLRDATSQERELWKKIEDSAKLLGLLDVK